MVLIDHEQGAAGTSDWAVFPARIELGPILPRKPALALPAATRSGGRPAMAEQRNIRARPVQDAGVAAFQVRRRVPAQFAEFTVGEGDRGPAFLPSLRGEHRRHGQRFNQGLRGRWPGRFAGHGSGGETLDDPVAAVLAPITQPIVEATTAALPE